MSSTAAHCIIGAALALPSLKWRQVTALLPSWRIPFSSALLAAAPDLDLFGRRAFGIPYDSLLSHRGLFHSPFFLILISAALAGIVARGHSRTAFAWLWLLWAGCMLTHPLLDALTDGGRGVMLLLPFTRVRLFLPWRPIYTPPGGIENILSRACLIRRSEIPFCVTAAVIGVVGLLAQRRRLASG